MPAPTRTSYFAYGSNMCAPRLRERAPSAQFRTTGFLRGHELRFHKRGIDGSGKCDAHLTNNVDDQIWGVVFDIHSAHQSALDRAEWIGTGYERKLVLIDTAEGTRLEAFAYHALPSAIARGLHPYRWYRDLVIAGAKQHELPTSYVAMLQRVTTREDPDTNRATRQRLLLPAWYQA